MFGSVMVASSRVRKSGVEPDDHGAGKVERRRAAAKRD